MTELRTPPRPRLTRRDRQMPITELLPVLAFATSCIAVPIVRTHLSREKAPL